MSNYTNGRSSSGGTSTPSAETLQLIRVALTCLDAGCGHDEWFRTGAAVHTMTGGSDEGLELFDAWSLRSRKYPSRRRIEYQWATYGKNKGRRIGMATLRRFVEASGTTWSWVCAAADLGEDRRWL